jgi:peptidoglycan hydrolase-like protein with peptidoglycan-binding domain
MLNKPTSSLFCKNTRRIVKKFKKKNGMIVDSIVDKETWNKVMKTAKELLPSIINE